MGFKAGRTFNTILAGGLLAVCCYGSDSQPLKVVWEVQSSAVERELSYPNTTRTEVHDYGFGPVSVVVHGHYETNLRVAIKISAPAGARVALDFTRFELSDGDYVQLLDSLEDVDSAERLTSYNGPGGPLTSAGSTLYIGITTDDYDVPGGWPQSFAFRYRAIGPAWTLPDIVEELNSSSSVQQFHFPPPTGSHTSRIFSVVKVSAPQGKRVRLLLYRTSLGDPNAYVQLLDGLSIPLMETQPKLRDASNEVFVSKSNVAFVLLNSSSPLAPTDTYSMSYLAVGCVDGDCDSTAVCEESVQEPGYTCTCPPGQVFADAEGSFCVPRDGAVAAISKVAVILERVEENLAQLLNLTAAFARE